MSRANSALTRVLAVGGARIRVTPEANHGE